MIIIQKSKSVFVHNPRTGGNAIYKELNIIQQSNPLQHMGTEAARELIFQETWFDYWSFAFVRNPWDRYVSLYEHLHNADMIRGSIYPSPTSNSGMTKYAFDEWMYLSRNKFIKSIAFGNPQTKWTGDVSEVFLFEERGESIPYISDKIGVKLQNIKSNASGKQNHYTEYYKKKETIELVRDIDHETIKQYGYKFS